MVSQTSLLTSLPSEAPGQQSNRQWASSPPNYLSIDCHNYDGWYPRHHCWHHCPQRPQVSNQTDSEPAAPLTASVLTAMTMMDGIPDIIADITALRGPRSSIKLTVSQQPPNCLSIDCHNYDGWHPWHHCWHHCPQRPQVSNQTDSEPAAPLTASVLTAMTMMDGIPDIIADITALKGHRSAIKQTVN